MSGGLAYLSVKFHWGFSIAAGCLIASWLFLCRQCVKRDNKIIMEKFQHAFAVSNIEAPQFEIGGHYGFPAFTMTFSTAETLKRAEEAGCLSIFKRFLQEFYGHLGSRSNPFDAERALWATYKGWKPQLNPPQEKPPAPPPSETSR